MTILQETITCCTSGDSWHAKALPVLDVPAIMMSDGPHELRCQTESMHMAQDSTAPWR